VNEESYATDGHRSLHAHAGHPGIMPRVSPEEHYGGFRLGALQQQRPESVVNAFEEATTTTAVEAARVLMRPERGVSSLVRKLTVARRATVDVGRTRLQSPASASSR